MAVSASVAAARAAAVRNHFPRREVFQRDWYLHHPHGWNPRQWAPGRAWAWATWPDVELWFGWGNDLPPAYYDYGNMVYYQGDEVYYGTQPVATAAEYYRQAAALAASGAAIDPNAGPWMPLGVFAFVLGDASDTSRAFQLAVNRSGTIAGNYYDALTGIALPVQGAADRTSQRAAWTVGDNKITVYETGISNLTRNQRRRWCTSAPSARSNGCWSAFRPRPPAPAGKGVDGRCPAGFIRADSGALVVRRHPVGRDQLDQLRRERTPSLCISRARRSSMVRTLKSSSAAIRRLVLPATIKPSTCFSARVSEDKCRSTSARCW